MKYSNWAYFLIYDFALVLLVKVGSVLVEFVLGRQKRSPMVPGMIWCTTQNGKKTISYHFVLITFTDVPIGSTASLDIARMVICIHQLAARGVVSPNCLQEVTALRLVLPIYLWLFVEFLLLMGMRILTLQRVHWIYMKPILLSYLLQEIIKHVFQTSVSVDVAQTHLINSQTTKSVLIIRKFSGAPADCFE